MNIATVITALGVMAAFVYALRSEIKQRKSGSHCSGCCATCGGCCHSKSACSPNIERKQTP